MIKKILIVCLVILSVSYSKEKKELFYEDNQNGIKVYYIEDKQSTSASFEMYNKNNKLINSYVARKIDLGFYSIIGKDYIFVYVNDKNKNDNKIEFFDPYSNILIGKEEKINENTVIQEFKIPIYSDDIYISTKRKLKNGQIEGIQTIKNIMDKSITKLNFVKGKKQGSMIKIFNDGEKIKCNYKNDKREGLCSYFYKNGELKRETNYVNDKKDGTLKQFNEGKVTSIMNYRNGKKHGKFIKYYENTNIIKITKNYKYGKLDGDSFEYFKTGKKKNKKTYKKDKLLSELIFNPLNEKVIEKILFNGYANREGKMKKYFSNGKVNLIYNYKNNNKYGVQKEFYENKVLKKETIYIKNYIKSIKEYNRKGVLIKSYEHNFDKNEALEKEYYIDGALKSTVKYNKRGYRLPQTLKKFNENTHKSINAKIVNGKKEGKEILYDSNGDLKRISNYKNGKIKSIEYESGLVSKITNYKNGKLDGEEKRYLSGYLSSITYYKNGKKLKYKSFTSDEYSFARGILQKYEEYCNGYLDGVVKIYNNLGLLKEYKEYKDGKLNGVVKTYTPDGILEQYEEYKNDILDGITKRYDVDGNILYVETYKEGKLNGNYRKYFYDNPNVLEEKGSYKNDKLNGYVESYYKNKQLKSKILYTNGEEDYTDIQNYYKNGNKKSIAFKKNNTINFKNYYENGKILSVGTVNKITNNNELKEYHPNSQLAKHIKIVNGKEIINKKYNNKGDDIE